MFLARGVVERGKQIAGTRRGTNVTAIGIDVTRPQTVLSLSDFERLVGLEFAARSLNFTTLSKKDSRKIARISPRFYYYVRKNRRI